MALARSAGPLGAKTRLALKELGRLDPERAEFIREIAEAKRACEERYRLLGVC